MIELAETIDLSINGTPTKAMHRPGKYLVVDLAPLLTQEYEWLINTLMFLTTPMENGSMEKPLRLYLSPLLAAKFVAEHRQAIISMNGPAAAKIQEDTDLYDGKEHFIGRWTMEGGHSIEILYTSTVPDDLLIFRY